MIFSDDISDINGLSLRANLTAKLHKKNNVVTIQKKNFCFILKKDLFLHMLLYLINPMFNKSKFK